MADTWRENAIVQAIQIITDKKISQAGYDKTIKGIINKVIDEVAGKYEVRYQDSLFEAYATSAKIKYEKDQQVSVLVPGNDWDRTKTILSGVNNVATNYQQVPVVGQQYNNIGPSGTSINNIVELSSYADDVTIDITDKVNINDISNYIKKGDSLALGMTVRTAFADSQFGGKYGLIFNIAYKDNVTGNQVIRQFQVDQSDVIGHPYRLTSPTNVETLIKNADTSNFIRVDSIQAFCNGFPTDSSKEEIKDIFISDIRVNGAKALTDDQLKGYILHIDDSAKGNTLGGSITQIPLVAILKINGKPTTQNVVYYWFRQNGTVFRGHDRYSGYAGDGWECLNNPAGSGFVPKKNGKFNFNTKKDILGQMSDSDKENPEIKDLTVPTALVPQKVMKVLCVAVYNNQDWITGQIEVINNNAKDIKIESSDLIDGINKTQYFLDNGSPTLTCKVYNTNGQQDSNAKNYSYSWSLKFTKGFTNKINPSSIASVDPYLTALNNYQTQLNKVSKMAENSAIQYKEKIGGEYQKAVNTWKNFEGKQYIYKNIYYNFPIKKIFDYGMLFCSVFDNNKNYIGTGNITLYNRQTLKGTYSLNILNGIQIFQYDEKGNSPFVTQIDRKATEGIKPATLGFTLLDNTNKQITYQQIINNGYVKWLFPGYDTLLISNQGNPTYSYDDTTAPTADRQLSSGLYNIYKNKENFSYSIIDKYKLSSVNNTIKLIVKFKDIILQSYTDFTFPKNGDPGTNGTDLISKLIPSSGNNLINSDRVYAHRINNNNQSFYTDSGSAIDSFKFFVYNNNEQVYNTASFWSCPPKTATKDKDKTDKNFIVVNASSGVLTLKTEKPIPSVNSSDIISNKPIHIVRGKKTVTDGNYSVDYMAEYPICYVYTKGNYRIKIKPKTGFKYVVYQQDGTRPDYDNQPFELIVEQRIEIDGIAYWTTDNVSNVSGTWYSTSGIKSISPKTGNKVTVIPSETFNGQDLTCAIVVDVTAKIGSTNTNIGFIHIPIYKIINRYGNNAINGWDGNSIELGADTGTILAPQVGAGRKNNTANDNTFTGVLMGEVKTGNKSQTGLFGYNNGVRSIFMDAQTGKTILGKQGAGQITIDPGQDTARIYSGNYSTTAGTGMEIDLTDPHIKFGSGHFSVDSSGNLTAVGGGKIANWSIGNTRLTSQSGNVYLDSGSNASYAIYSNGTFTVTPGGYMTSTSGKIAKWNINANALTDGNVGMGQGKTITANTFNNQSSAITNARIWSGTGTGDSQVTFAVGSDGKLWSKSGQIANWSISQNRLTDGNVGMGQVVFQKASRNSQNPFGEAITARFWGSSKALSILSDNNVADNSSSGIDGLNFAVSDDGKLYSKAGKIGGWNITGTTLSSGNTVINSNGSLSNSGGGNGTWAINNDGSSSFTNINASGGKIGNYTINNGQLSNGNVTLTQDGKLIATGGQIGGFTIGSSTLQGGNLILSSSGAMSGPGWSIDSNGNAKFANSQGTFSAGGGSSVNGGFSCGASGGGAWGGPAATMKAETITLYTSLGLSRVSSGSNSANPGWRIPTSLTTYTAPTGIKENSQGWTKMVQGTISGQTSKGDSITGSCTIYIPIYELDYTNGPQYTVIDNATNIGTTLVTGWNLSNTKTATYDFLCSGNPNQETKQDG